MSMFVQVVIGMFTGAAFGLSIMALKEAHENSKTLQRHHRVMLLMLRNVNRTPEERAAVLRKMEAFVKGAPE